MSVNYKVQNSNDGQRKSFVNRSPMGSQRGICQDGFYPARLSRGSSLAWIELKYGRDDESLRTVCLPRLLSNRSLLTATLSLQSLLPTLCSHIIEIASQISAERHEERHEAEKLLSSRHASSTFGVFLKLTVSYLATFSIFHENYEIRE